MDSDECWKVQQQAHNKDIFVQIFVELGMSGWKYMFSKKDLGQRFCQKVYLVISEKFLQN